MNQKGCQKVPEISDDIKYIVEFNILNDIINPTKCAKNKPLFLPNPSLMYDPPMVLKKLLIDYE